MLVTQTIFFVTPLKFIIKHIFCLLASLTILLICSLPLFNPSGHSLNLQIQLIESLSPLFSCISCLATSHTLVSFGLFPDALCLLLEYLVDYLFEVHIYVILVHLEYLFFLLLDLSDLHFL